MKTLAILDDFNKLLGFEEVANSRYKDSKNRVAVIDGCDLDPKAGDGYYYNWEDKAFIPYRNKIKERPNFSWRAMAEGFIKLEEEGFILPETTKEFCNMWKRQIAKEGN